MWFSKTGRSALCLLLLLLLVTSPTVLGADTPDEANAFACQPRLVSGTIGSGSPDHPSTTGLQTSRLFRNAVSSPCGTQKPTPSLTDVGTTFAYDSYRFVNPFAITVCVTVTTSAAANNQLFFAAYQDAFVPANPQTNYIGDAGDSDKVRSFSFMVDGFSEFYVVVSRVNNAANPTSLAYSFRMMGLPGCPVCPPELIRGTLGQATSSFPATLDTQTGRLFRNADASVCGTAKATPSVEDATSTFAFHSYTFTNNTSAPICVTATLESSPNQMLIAGYIDGFDPFDIQTHYAGDGGASNRVQTMSFTVPINRPFTVVVSRVNNAANPPSLDYGLRIRGVPNCAICPPRPFAGAVGSGSPTYPAHSTSQSGTLALGGNPSVCGATKPTPARVDPTGPYPFDAYMFMNEDDAPACVNVVTRTPAADRVSTVAYLGEFVRTDPSLNYAADGGSTFTSTQLAFTVPAKTPFVIVVTHLDAPTNPSPPVYTLDVNGLTCSPSTDRGFFPLTPCRLLDTRNPNGPMAGPVLAPDGSRGFFLSQSLCGIPLDAKSVSLNVTAVSPSASGFLRLDATGAPVPPTSVTAFRPGTTRAVNAFVRVSPDAFQGILIANRSAGTTHVVVDVNGYFK